jgi:small subunit ribosomal protein S16
MLRIRLRRVGAKKQPSYRIVVAESTSPRDGKFVEAIGFYNPRTEPETVKIDEGRALHWLSVGASPSDAVARIFTTHGTMERFEKLRAGAELDHLVAEAESARADVVTTAATKPVKAAVEVVEAPVEDEAVAEAVVEDVVDEALPEASEPAPESAEED